MYTIIYGIIGIFILIAAAFLFTYYQETLALLSNGRTCLSDKRKRFTPHMLSYVKMAMRISDRNGYYPTRRS